MTNPNLSPHQRHTHRVILTVPEYVYVALVTVSHAQGRSISNLGAHLLERALQTFFNISPILS